MNIESLPKQLEPTVQMEHPNASIPVYSGLVQVIQNDTVIECRIEMTFNWTGLIGVDFLIKTDQSNLYSVFLHHMVNDEPITFSIPNLKMGNPVILSLDERNGAYSVSGWINAPIIKKTEKSVHENSERTLFHLLNFNNILGKNTHNGTGRCATRLIFKTPDFIINVDFIVKFGEQQQKKKHRGYCLTHVGELASTDGKILSEDARDDILNYFGLFVSFLAGIKSSCFFRTVITSEGVLQDYNNYPQDSCVNVRSWLPMKYDKFIGDVWTEFYNLCQDDYDFETMNLVIHWYLSANKKSGGIEGAIILLQNAFEMLYNWMVIEKENMLSSDGAERLRASDKIRMLLYLIKCDHALPERYQEEFHMIIKPNPWLNDFPYVFTEIRNSFVHSDRKKRQKIRELPARYLHVILECGLYYVELLLLYQLKYGGKIASRISANNWRGGNEYIVPWHK